jgi:hypothetical protein
VLRLSWRLRWGRLHVRLTVLEVARPWSVRRKHTSRWVGSVELTLGRVVSRMGDAVLRRVRHASIDRYLLRRIATRRGAVRGRRRWELPMNRWLVAVLLSWVTT